LFISNICDFLFIFRQICRIILPACKKGADTVEPRSYSNLSPKRGWSWETPPAKIPEEQIAQTLEADVAIIGGGISGLAAGARCVQLGMSAVIVDRFRELMGRAGHVGVLDSAVMRRLGITIDKKRFARDWMMISGSRVSEELLWLYINRSGEAFDWLMEQGGDDVDATIYTGYYKGPVFSEYPGTHVVFQKQDRDVYKYRMGGMLVVEILERTFLQGGGRLFRRIRAEQLEKDENGRVVSFLAKSEEDGRYRRYVGKNGIIIASGDIEGDPEMLEAFCPLALLPTNARYFPKGNNTGDGHKMAYWAGAAFDNPSWALSLHGRKDDETSYYSFYFLFVNSRGKRFMNEDTWTQAKSMRVLHQPGGDVAFTVMDSKWLQEFGERFEMTGGQAVTPLSIANWGDKWSPDCGLKEAVDMMIEKGKCAWKADTLEELAERMGVPADNLKATVARYNELVALGDDLDFGKRGELLTSITKPPFYALKWGCSLLDVFGGALTDTDMRVLDPYHEPIPGLYAVGNAAGGFYGVDYPLIMNGNSFGRALTWGLAVTEGIEKDSAQDA
jgi:succinate dehydrogenase/fumarate reductase flavoprotein subunit